jgi:hypothetical protein
MARVHTIRLRGHWQVDHDPDGVRSSRSFRRPTGLTETERVVLVLPPNIAWASLRINDGLVLPISSPPLHFDITEHLRPRNEVIVLTDSNGVAEARLEIHAVDRD